MQIRTDKYETSLRPQPTRNMVATWVFIRETDSVDHGPEYHLCYDMENVIHVPNSTYGDALDKIENGNARTDDGRRVAAPEANDVFVLLS